MFVLISFGTGFLKHHILVLCFSGEDMLAFYPLSERYGGKDVLHLAKPLELKQVTFDDVDSQQWKSPPAHFAGTEESFGVDMDDSRLSTSGSFSVVASVYPVRRYQLPRYKVVRLNG